MDALGWGAEKRWDGSYLNGIGASIFTNFFVKYSKMPKQYTETAATVPFTAPLSFVYLRAFNPKKLLPSGPTWNSTSWGSRGVSLMWLVDIFEVASETEVQTEYVAEFSSITCMRLFLASDLSRNEHLLHGCMASVATSEMEMLTDPM